MKPDVHLCKTNSQTPYKIYDINDDDGDGDDVGGAEC